MGLRTHYRLNELLGPSCKLLAIAFVNWRSLCRSSASPIALRYNLAVNPNTKHLVKWWAVILAAGGLLLVGMTFGVIGGLRRGEYTPVVALAIGVAFAAFSVLRGRRKALALFRETTPDRAIAFYHRAFKRAPNGKALAAHSSAYAAVLYGEFDRAREELGSLNWDALPPMYQGFEAHIHSLLAIFQAKDYLKALLLAEEARDLTEASKSLPGVATSREAHDANVAICELLTGKRDPELLSQLDRACKNLPGVAPAIPSWALATYYAKSGQSEAAKRYSSIVRRLLPHSILLHDLDGAAQSS